MTDLIHLYPILPVLRTFAQEPRDFPRGGFLHEKDFFSSAGFEGWMLVRNLMMATSSTHLWAVENHQPGSFAKYERQKTPTSLHERLISQTRDSSIHVSIDHHEEGTKKWDNVEVSVCGFTLSALVCYAPEGTSLVTQALGVALPEFTLEDLEMFIVGAFEFIASEQPIEEPTHSPAESCSFSLPPLNSAPDGTLTFTPEDWMQGYPGNPAVVHGGVTAALLNRAADGDPRFDGARKITFLNRWDIGQPAVFVVDEGDQGPILRVKGRIGEKASAIIASLTAYSPNSTMISPAPPITPEDMAQASFEHSTGLLHHVADGHDNPRGLRMTYAFIDKTAENGRTRRFVAATLPASLVNRDSALIATDALASKVGFIVAGKLFFTKTMSISGDPILPEGDLHVFAEISRQEDSGDSDNALSVTVYLMSPTGKIVGTRECLFSLIPNGLIGYFFPSPVLQALDRVFDSMTYVGNEFLNILRDSFGMRGYDELRYILRYPSAEILPDGKNVALFLGDPEKEVVMAFDDTRQAHIIASLIPLMMTKSSGSGNRSRFLFFLLEAIVDIGETLESGPIRQAFKKVHALFTQSRDLGKTISEDVGYYEDGTQRIIRKIDQFSQSE